MNFYSNDFERANIKDSYQLIREIGKGEQGVVYLGYNKKNPKVRVAIKELKTITEKNIKLLQQEIAYLKLLLPICHPNILCYENAIFDGQKYYLVTQYIEGQNLSSTSKWLKAQYYPQNQDMYYDIIYQLLTDLLKALSLIHDRNIIHGDIKSDNIIVKKETDINSENGQTQVKTIFQPVFIDFGLSCLTSNDSCNRVAGSPIYIAPEYIQHRKPSPSSDIWALGISFYIALYNNDPWPEEIFDALTLFNYISTGSYNISIDTPNSNLNHVLNNMLDKNPMKRQSVRDLLN